MRPLQQLMGAAMATFQVRCAVLWAALAMLGPAAFGGPPPHDLPHIVSEVPVTYTPKVVNGGWPNDLHTQVWAFVPYNGVMYACGDFQQVTSSDGQTKYERKSLFAFDPNTGAVNDWAPV